MPTTMPLKQSKRAAAEARKQVEKLYDHLYANGSVRTPESICSEVCKVLHTAQFLEETNEKECAFSFNRSEKDAILQSGGTSSASGISETMRRAFSQMNTSWELYSSDDSLLLSDSDISYACACLNGIQISTPDRDVVGDSVEIFRTQWTKRNGGQFFTDQQVTNLAIDLLGFSPLKGESLVDPCAGTGGFLLAAVGKLRELLEEAQGDSETEAELHRLAPTAICGGEVDGEISRMANASLSARLGGISSTLVSNCDSLSPENSALQLDSFDCSASNPPFGTKITIKDPKVLRQFELPYLRNKTGGGKPASLPPDILFLEQNIRLVRPGSGRIAIVLPYQIFSGPATRYVREWLLRNLKVNAVIDLPPETFQPHTGTKTCLLVGSRRSKPSKSLASVRPYKIFMSVPKWIGHDRRGRPVYRKAEDGSSTEQILTDIQEVYTAYKAFRSGKLPEDHHKESFILDASRVLGDPDLHLNAKYHAHSKWLELANSTSLANSSNNWSQVRLGDVTERVFCPGRFKRNYISQGENAVPFLGGTNTSQFVVETSKFLSDRDPILDQVRVSEGWILVTRSGSTGIVSVVPKSWDGWAISEHVIRIVPNAKKIDPAYLYAYLKTEHAKTQLAQGVFGSVIDEITPEYIENLTVWIPKSEAKHRKISKKVREGERMRSKALQAIVEGIGELDYLLQC